MEWGGQGSSLRRRKFKLIILMETDNPLDSQVEFEADRMGVTESDGEVEDFAAPAQVEEEDGLEGDDTAGERVKEETSVLCCVCRDDEADEDNPILFCDGGCGHGACTPKCKYL